MPSLLTSSRFLCLSHPSPYSGSISVGNLKLKPQSYFSYVKTITLGLLAQHPDRRLATASSQEALPGDCAHASKNNSVSKNSACSILSKAGASRQLVCISVESDGIPLYYSEPDAPPSLPLLPFETAIERAVFI